MPTPTEHTTVQAPILGYAEAIGCTVVSREETEESLKLTESGFSNPLHEGKGGQECPPSVESLKLTELKLTESGFSNPLHEEKGGQECPLSVESLKLTESGFSNPLHEEKGGQECPPSVGGKGGQECPPSVEGSFLNPYGEIEKTSHHLSHWQQGEAWVFVTWRLGDSLPKGKLEQWKTEREAWMKHHLEPWDEMAEAQYHDRFSRQIDEWLDQGSGACVLKDPANAKIVADALRHFDGERYKLASFVVMPNHVHALFRPFVDHALPDIVKSWKGFSAREINKRMGKSGALWQDEYWDRLIRNARHFFKVAEYIRENPVKAKLRDGQFLLESAFSKESGLSSPLPKANGGQECPPSVHGGFS